jgi:hypothetical protein
MSFPLSEIITSQNLLSRCDYLFAHNVDTGDSVTTIVTSELPNLKSNDLVYCKTNHVKLLADVLKQHVSPETPFTVITHESDYELNEYVVSLFEGMSASFYGMNCVTKAGNPLPIGVASSYCKITLKANHFPESISPSKLLYLNHRIETNPTERRWLYDHFANKKWCDIRHPYPKGETESYRNELIDHKFLICPRGNGIDTHRLWEALYCGVIPVVRRHMTHSMLEGNLPVLFVDDYREVDEDLLNKTYENFSTRKWNRDMLRVSWWIDKMKGRI